MSSLVKNPHPIGVEDLYVAVTVDRGPLPPLALKSIESRIRDVGLQYSSFCPPT